MQLHQDYYKFKEKTTEIVAIGPENAESFRAYWEANGLSRDPR